MASEEDGQRDKGKTESSGESCASCSGKGEAELRHQITREVSREFADGMYPGADLAYLRSLVEQRYNRLRKTRNHSNINPPE